MVYWNQINCAMPFETTFLLAADWPDAGFDLLFGELFIATVIGHVEYTTGLEFVENVRIFFDDNKHGVGFAPPYLELI
jgi:hypothetical protein